MGRLGTVLLLLLIQTRSTVGEVGDAKSLTTTAHRPFLILEHPHEPYHLTTYAFAPDSRSVYTITHGFGPMARAMYQTDLRSGKHLRAGQVSTSTGPIRISSDGTRMVVGDYWVHGPSLAETGERVRLSGGQVYFLSEREYLLHIAGKNRFSASQWIVHTFDGERRMLELSVPESIPAPHMNLDMAHAVSPDGTRTAALFREGQVRVWSLANGDLLASTRPVADRWGPPPYGNDSGMWPRSDGIHLQFTPDGKHLWLHRPGYPLQRWRIGDDDSVTVEFPDQLTAQPRKLPSLDFPDLHVIDQETRARAAGQILRPTDAPPADFVLPVHFPPARGASYKSDFPYLHETRSRITADGTIAATMLENGRIALWDIASRKVIRILPIIYGKEHPPSPDLHPAGFNVAFSPNGKLIAIQTSDTDLEIWRVADEEDAKDEGQTVIIDDRRLRP